jgi:hypothetical protein
MTLDAETNLDGVNALARTHSIVSALPELLTMVKKHISCPSWPMGALVAEIERHMEFRQQDLDALQAMYEGLLGRCRASE